MTRGRSANPNRAQVRTERIEFRVTPDEKATIEQEAARMGLDVGTFVRFTVGSDIKRLRK